MSGLIYTFSRAIATVTTAQTLLQLEAGAAPKRLELLRAWIHGQVTTDEAFAWAIDEVTADNTVTAADATSVQQHNVSGVDATVTYSTTATGYDSSSEGTRVPIVQGGASILLGMEWLPTPEERIWIAPTKLIGLRTLTTLTTTTLYCGFTFVEYQ